MTSWDACIIQQSCVFARASTFFLHAACASMLSKNDGARDLACTFVLFLTANRRCHPANSVCIVRPCLCWCSAYVHFTPQVWGPVLDISASGSLGEHFACLQICHSLPSLIVHVSTFVGGPQHLLGFSERDQRTQQGFSVQAAKTCAHPAALDCDAWQSTEPRRHRWFHGHLCMSARH